MNKVIPKALKLYVIVIIKIIALFYLLRQNYARSFLSAFVTSRLKEVNYIRENQGHNRLKGRRPTSHALNKFRDAIKFIIGNGFIFLMALLSILGIGISGIIDEYNQLIASTIHSILSLAHNAFGLAVFSFFAAILSNLKAFDILRVASVYLLVLSLLMLLACRFVVSRKGV